jgi:hypothetical protein
VGRFAGSYDEEEENDSWEPSNVCLRCLDLKTYEEVAGKQFMGGRWQRAVNFA